MIVQGQRPALSDSWFETRTGTYLLREERRVLAAALPMIFGFVLVQAGDWGPPGSLLRASVIREQYVCSADFLTASQLCARPDYLPFTSDSVDAVLLPHTLERCADPYHVLRETERVLAGEGHLIVLGFHRWGAWGLWPRRSVQPWAGRFLRAGRVREWLAVLGFETLCLRHYLFRPPFSGAGLLRSAFLDHLHWGASAGAYLLVARKHVFAVTPMRLQRTRPARGFAGVANPTPR